MVVAAALVRPEDEVMLISTGGVLIRTKVQSIREMSRSTQGVTLINLAKGEKLAGLERVVEPDDERIARMGAAHGDRAGERMPAERPAPQHVLVRRVLRVVQVGGVAGVEDDGVAGIDRQARGQRVVPLLVDLVVAEVVRRAAHASSFHTTMPVPER